MLVCIDFTCSILIQLVAQQPGKKLQHCDILLAEEPDAWIGGPERAKHPAVGHVQRHADV
jgi:hypothetical protein